MANKSRGLLIILAVVIFLLVGSTITEQLPAQTVDFGPGDLFTADVTPILTIFIILAVVMIWLRWTATPPGPQ
jgi:hypothetical protein